MATKLATLLPSFGGVAAFVHCFDHIVNLISQEVLRPSKSGDTKGDGDGDAVLDSALQELASGFGLEDLEDEDEGEADGLGDGDEFDLDQLVDDCEGLSDQEKQDLKEDMKPIKQLMTKV